MNTPKTDNGTLLKSTDLFCLDVGETIQRGDLFQANNELYLEMDNLGRMLGIRTLGRKVKKRRAWFRNMAPITIVAKFRKKPVEIEAIQFTETSGPEIERWAGDTVYSFHGKLGTMQLIVETFDGSMIANVGDWIIKDVNGEFHPCKPDIFAATYDAV